MRRLETVLNCRVLRFDGVSIVQPDDLAELLLRGVKPSQLRVSELTPDIELFNVQASDSDQIRQPEPTAVNIDLGWRLPKDYLDLDLEFYIAARFEELVAAGYPEELHQEAIDRIFAELQEIKRRGMTEFAKTIIFILDTLRRQNLIWGVGRGSSCASYILFLIGLHVVDCVKFKVPLTEFFHD